MPILGETLVWNGMMWVPALLVPGPRGPGGGCGMAGAPGPAGATGPIGPSGGGGGPLDVAPFFFEGDRTSMVSSGGDVLQWNDLRGPTFPVFLASATPPPLDASGGVGPAGLNDYLQATTSIPADDDVVLFLVSEQISAAGGGILEMSDSGTSNRSVMNVNDSGFRAAKYAGVGTAFFAYAGAQPLTLQTVFYDEFSRGFLTAGIYTTDTNLKASAVRSPTTVRLLNYVQGGAPFDGVISALYIAIQRPRDEIIDQTQIDLSAQFGLPAPPVLWPPAPASVTTGDPRFVLPPFIDCVAGQDCEIWKESIRYRDGFTTTTLLASALTPDPLAPPDRWRLRSPPIGVWPMTWSESGFFGSTVVRVSPPVLGPGLGPINICCVGDSITQAGSWVWRLNVAMNGKLNMIGSLTIDGIKQEGRSGWTYTLFDSPGSPFFTGAVLDIPGYVAANGTPKIVLYVLGTNDWNTNDAGIEAAINISFGHLDNHIAAWHALDPTIAVVVVTPFPGNGNSSPWGSVANRYQFLRCMNRGVRRALDTYGGREAQEIYVAWPFGQIDSQRGFRYDSGVGDTLHPNRIVGDREIARALYGWVNWYVQSRGL